MTRRIVTTKEQAFQPGRETDNYIERIVKYIPTEIVGAWIAIKGIVQAANPGQQDVVLWVCFALALILTPLYMLRATAEPGKPQDWKHAVISAGAFVVWACALGEPFAAWLGPQNQSLYGSILLIFYTLAIGLIHGGEEKHMIPSPQH